MFALMLVAAVVSQAAAIGKVVWSVNAGGESHTDSFGIFYARDTLPLELEDKPNGVAKMQDMILYQTERYHTATFGYDIPVKEDGQYVLVLKFSEVWFAAPQQKVFDVLVNGEHSAVSDLDIFARVGRGVAHDEIIPFEVSKGILRINGESSAYDGTLSVEFIKREFDNPKVNAIYVMKGKPDDVPKLQPPKKRNVDQFEDEFEEEEEPMPEEEEEMSEEDLSLLEHKRMLKRQQREQRQREETKRRSHSSGQQAADPFESEDTFMSSTLLPVAAAIVAFIPLIVCLWRL